MDPVGQLSPLKLPMEGAQRSLCNSTPRPPGARSPRLKAPSQPLQALFLGSTKQGDVARDVEGGPSCKEDQARLCCPGPAKAVLSWP